MGSSLLFGCFLANHEANGESVPNTYCLTLLLTGNEARERFHHALGFSVAMRFERFDDLYFADVAVFKNYKTEQDDTLHMAFFCLFGILEVLSHVSQQGRLTSGENGMYSTMVCTSGLLSSSLTGRRSCFLLLFCALSVAVMVNSIATMRRCFSIVLRIWELVWEFG